MTIVAHTHPFVIGVDTHARNHSLAILAAPTGEVIDDAQFPATAAGLTRAVSWVARRTSGDIVSCRSSSVGVVAARMAHAEPGADPRSQ
jgi:transposase